MEIRMLVTTHLNGKKTVGDVYTVDATTAERWIVMGIAEAVSPPEPPEPPAPPEPDKPAGKDKDK